MRRNWKWYSTTHQSVLAWTSDFFGESEADTRGAGPTWPERVLAARWLGTRGEACKGLGGKRHRRKRKKNILTTEEIVPLPRRTVQGDTSSTDVETDLLKEMVERTRCVSHAGSAQRVGECFQCPAEETSAEGKQQTQSGGSAGIRAKSSSSREAEVTQARRCWRRHGRLNSAR